MGNGQWVMGNGQLSIGNGQWYKKKEQQVIEAIP
jgi:hypothetical protein